MKETDTTNGLLYTLTMLSSDSFPLFLRWLVDTKQFEVWKIIDVVEKPYHFNEEWEEFITDIGT